MSSLIKDLKNASNVRKFTVWGYIREREAQFNLIAVPQLICYTVLQFYKNRGDYFNLFDKGFIKLNSNKCKATVSADYLAYAACYGYQKVTANSGGKYEWEFEIDTIRKHIRIGISSQQPSTLNTHVQRFISSYSSK